METLVIPHILHDHVDELFGKLFKDEPRFRCIANC